MLGEMLGGLVMGDVCPLCKGSRVIILPPFPFLQVGDAFLYTTRPGQCTPYLLLNFTRANNTPLLTHQLFIFYFLYIQR